MRLRAAVLLTGVLAVTGPALAQRSLGELGGPIRLDATPTPAAGGVVIDQQAVGQVGPASGHFADPAQIRAGVDALRASAGALQVLVDQTEHSWAPFVDLAWLRLVHNAREDVALTADELRVMAPSPDYVAAWREARAAAAALLELVQPLEDGYQAGHAPILKLVEPVRAAVARFDGILTAIDRRRQQLALEAPQVVLTTGAAEDIARAVCTKRFSGAGIDQRMCLDRQRQAARAIQARISFAVGLDDAAFNRIRSACGDEFPADLVARDSCEQSRMGAVAARQ